MALKRFSPYKSVKLSPPLISNKPFDVLNIFFCCEFKKGMLLERSIFRKD